MDALRPAAAYSRGRRPMPEPITGEHNLWRLWERRHLPATLRTRDGRLVRVLFPGIAATQAGPDFMGALLAFDAGAAMRGDVEVHLLASSWSGHGHHLDPRYNGVILHVVLSDDGGPALTAGGTLIPVLCAGPLLEQPVRPQTLAAAGPCRQMDAPRPDPARLPALLVAAGQERFAARACRWEGEWQSLPAESCMLQALLRAAGLGRNAEACAALAAAIDGPVLESLLARHDERGRLLTATATLLGMAGLLEQAHAGDDVRDRWRATRAYWPAHPLHARQWQRFRVRPANLPETRLALIAALIARRGLVGLLEDLVLLIDRAEPQAPTALIAALATPGLQSGRSWALEAWANVLLPLLAGYGGAMGRPALAERAEACYRSLPGGGENAVLGRMCAIAGLRLTPRRAIEQQGLLELWTRHCSVLACDNCPVAGAAAARQD